MIELRTPAEIEQMRPAGRFVAEVLAERPPPPRVGINLLELDRIAHEMIRARGAESCYIDYHPSFGARPFGKVLCTSVNDAVLHGLPHDYRLQDGDLVSLDFAASRRRLGRRHRRQLVVGTPRAEDLRLIDTTQPGTRRRHRRRRSPAAGSATSRPRSPRSRTRRATPSTLSSAATASGARCTATRTSPNDGRAGRGSRCARDS